jgi:hypothetical protein
MRLKKLIDKYAYDQSDQKEETGVDIVDLPPNYSDWPSEWQKAYDNRVTIMVSFWPDYPIEKIQKQADYWTRYYHRKKQGMRVKNAEE